jgi:hypothetical protein
VERVRTVAYLWPSGTQAKVQFAFFLSCRMLPMGFRARWNARGSGAPSTPGRPGYIEGRVVYGMCKRS